MFFFPQERRSSRSMTRSETQPGYVCRKKPDWIIGDRSEHCIVRGEIGSGFVSSRVGQ